MPQLTTPRLILREMRADDSRALLGTFRDPLVMAAFGVDPFDIGQMDRWVARNLAHQQAYGYGLFTVVLKEDGSVIGDCRLEEQEVGTELGYDLQSSYWNRGLATEAAAAVRDFALGELGMSRVVSLVRTGNARSRRVAEKIGMTLERELERDSVRYWLYAIEARRLSSASRSAGSRSRARAAFGPTFWSGPARRRRITSSDAGGPAGSHGRGG